MASYGSIKRECDNKNRARNVDVVSSYDLVKFWDSAAERRFLISGGTQEQRENALMKKILHDMEENTMPTIILNTSSRFRQLFQETLSQEEDADWIVFSEENRDYHVGYGMTKENLKRFLYDRAIALYQNVNDQFNNYLDAFLSVLEQYFTLSLPAMIQLAEYSIEKIAVLGEKRDVDLRKLDLIRMNPEAGATLKVLLLDTYQAFRMITTEDCGSELGLLSAEWENDSVALIQVNSEYPDVINSYFVRVLRQLKTKKRFRLILNGIPMGEEDEIKRFVMELRSDYEIELGICDEDVFPVIQAEEHLVNFAVQLIFLRRWNRGVTPTKQIRELGDYFHYEPTRGGGKGAELVQIIPTSDWGMTHEARDRIRQEDLEGHEAILKGVHGEKLILAKRVK